MMKNLKYLLVPIFFFLLIGAGCQKPFVPEPYLVIERHSWRFFEKIEGGFWVEVNGEAVNQGNVDLTYAEIWITYLNASGEVIAKDYMWQSNIAQGETWHFMILYKQNIRPDSYFLEVGDLRY